MSSLMSIDGFLVYANTWCALREFNKAHPGKDIFPEYRKRYSALSLSLSLFFSLLYFLRVLRSMSSLMSIYGFFFFANTWSALREFYIAHPGKYIFPEYRKRYPALSLSLSLPLSLSLSLSLCPLS